MGAIKAPWMEPIIRVPLQQAFPQLGEVKEFSNKICLFSHDRSRVFDVVSPQYQVIDHGEAFNRINKALETTFGAKIKSNVRSLADGARLRVEFKLPIAPIALKKGDITELSLIMRNSYDRTWAFSALLGAMRMVCSNGMMIGQNFAGVHGKHVSTMDEKSLLLQLETTIARAPKLKELWQLWEQTKVTKDNAVAMLGGLFPDKYLDPVLAQVFPMTKWQLYNHLTHFATHDTRSVLRRVEFDEKIGRLFYDMGAAETVEE